MGQSGPSCRVLGLLTMKFRDDSSPNYSRSLCFDCDMRAIDGIFELIKGVRLDCAQCENFSLYEKSLTILNR